MKLFLLLLLTTLSALTQEVKKHDKDHLELTHTVQRVLYLNEQWVVALTPVNSYFGETNYLLSLNKQPQFKVGDKVTFKGKRMNILCENDVLQIVLVDWEVL